MDEPATEVEEGFEGCGSQLVLPLKREAIPVKEVEWSGIPMPGCSVR
jgi:hypothetical protein